jgi:uncharacterized membrane protein YphA (DoxX/SURF4 family)
MLVVLRLALGWHFLYEGVWKIHHPEFSAEPFLSEAKGPLAPMFYGMLDDLDGTKHLVLGDDDKGHHVVKAESTLAAWEEFKDGVATRYAMTDEQKKKADESYKLYESILTAYLADNADKMAGYFGSLKRFQDEQDAKTNGAPYYEKRTWDRQRELRKEVKDWMTDIGKMETGLRTDLWNLLTDEQKEKHGYFKTSWNPLRWSRAEQINFAVTYGLTAIGLCLMLGFCTRLAALGGVAFMVFVVLSQLPWPTIYPPPGNESGHSLGVDKNVIEMVALLLVATTRVGRWGGLDALLAHFLPCPCGCRKGKTENTKSGS